MPGRACVAPSCAKCIGATAGSETTAGASSWHGRPGHAQAAIAACAWAGRPCHVGARRPPWYVRGVSESISPSPSDRRWRVALVIVVSLALAVRLGWALRLPTSREYLANLPDQLEYLELAQ